MSSPKLRRAPDVAKLLAYAGLRPTRQRLALARLLFKGMHHHITAEALFAAAKRARLRLSRATVYNTLNQFTAAGLLQQIAVDVETSYFDTNTDHHHHFYDMKTNRLIDVPYRAIRISKLPGPPKGKRVVHVEVMMRVR